MLHCIFFIQEHALDFMNGGAPLPKPTICEKNKTIYENTHE